MASIHQRPRMMSSSLPPAQKIYNYLEISPVRPSVVSNSRYQHPRFLHSQQQTEYQLVVQFQLRRQKQKTSILQQRLRNKQSFIKQMKQFQDQLTQAYEKCQEQMLGWKKECQALQDRLALAPQYSTFSPQPAPDIAREYLQQIAELKHLVIRLEEEINFHEKKDRKGDKLHSSAQKQFSTNLQPRLNTQGLQQSKRSNIRKQRSKTLANDFGQIEKPYSSVPSLLQEILINKHKISSFLNHFLTMVQFFHPQLNSESTLKSKLKRAWKWTKNIVVEWNQLKNNNLEKSRPYKIGHITLKFLPVGISTEEAEHLLQKVFSKK